MRWVVLLNVSGNAKLQGLSLSMERLDEDENDARCPLGMLTQSVDRRCGSVSPINLPHTKQERIKSSSTDPSLSSAHAERSQDGNARYAVIIGLLSGQNLAFMIY